MITRKIKVTKLDWARAISEAYDRTVDKEVWQDSVQTRKSGLMHASTVGALGEVVFSRLTGLKIDPSLYFDRDDKCDFIAGDLRIEVKTREWSGDKLEMHLFPKEPKLTDVFVLFRIGSRCDEIELIGHITSDDVIENYKPRYHDHLYGRKIIVPAYAFRKPNEILDLVSLKTGKSLVTG